MVRTLVFAVFVFFAAAGIVRMLSGPSGAGVLSLSRTPTATSTVSTFNATGTITYYANNAGTQVPYLFYQTASGSTAAKILTFCEAAPGHYEGTVHVEGDVEDESVCANNIMPA